MHVAAHTALVQERRHTGLPSAPANVDMHINHARYCHAAGGVDYAGSAGEPLHERLHVGPKLTSHNKNRLRQQDVSTTLAGGRVNSRGTLD